MGVEGSFFELQPPNFGKLDIFERCSNDISSIFWNSQWVQSCQKCQEAARPGHPEVHALDHLTIFLSDKGTVTCPKIVFLKEKSCQIECAS